MKIENNLFFSYKKVVFIFLVGIVCLFMGKFLGDSIGVVSLLVFFLLLLRNKRDFLVLFLIFWVFLYEFYIGQGWVNNEIVSKYMIKGQFYIIITFFVFFERRWVDSRIEKKLFLWSMFFLLVVVFSDFMTLGLKPNFINQVFFVYLFLLVINLPKKRDFNTRLLNLIVAIGLLEVVICFLQVKQIIPPGSKIMPTRTASFLWEPGLDDVASGTFGVGISNVTSWFETMLFIFCFSFGVYKKKVTIIIFSFVFLLQYVTIDSKTALGVTAFAFMYLLYKLRIFNFLKFRNIVYVVMVFLAFVVMKGLIGSYYDSFLGNRHESGSEYIERYVSKSVDVIFENIEDWGKIAGFEYITKDYLKKDASMLITGYGRANFTYDTNGGRILDMDTSVMQLNNITRSFSSFISIYGSIGLLGLVLVLWLFWFLFTTIKNQIFTTDLGNSFQAAGLAILVGSFVFMFLYNALKYNDLAFLLFYIVFALVIRVEKDNTSHSKPLT